MSTVNPETQTQPEQEESGWILDNEGDGIDPLNTLMPGPPAPAAQPQPQQPIIPPAVQSQPSQFQVRVRTGQVFSGATPQEATDKAQAYFDRLQSESVRGYEGQPPPAQTQPQAPTWDDAKWYETLGRNPREAIKQALEDYFGIDDPASALSRSYDISIQVSDRIATAEFMANNQDFPASPESAAILVKRLAADNAELTSWNMEVAYRQLIREGVLAPIQQTAASGQQQQAAPNPQEPQHPYDSRGAGAPPSPPDGGAPPIDYSGRRDLTQDEFEQLTTAQMREYITNRRKFQQ